MFGLSGLSLAIVLLVGCESAESLLTEEGVAYQKNIYAQDNTFKLLYRPERNKIIIPTEQLFLPHSHKINREHIDVLREVVALHKANPDMKLVVKVHTDAIKKMNWAQNDTQTQIQAEVLASTLWAMGVPKSLLYYQGMEDAVPVASNATTKGSSMNRRIEIDMEVNHDE